jgi:hypothetical protein
MGVVILGKTIEAEKPAPKAELPVELRAKFEQKMEAYRRAWEDSRELLAVVDAKWLVENTGQPVPSWLKKAADKFPVDMGIVNLMHMHGSEGPRGTPQKHWGSFQFAQYGIQMLYPNPSENISRRRLVKEVREFLPTDIYFHATGRKVPSRRTIERALDKLLTR